MHTYKYRLSSFTTGANSATRFQGYLLPWYQGTGTYFCPVYYRYSTGRARRRSSWRTDSERSPDELVIGRQSSSLFLAVHLHLLPCECLLGWKPRASNHGNILCMQWYIWKNYRHIFVSLKLCTRGKTNGSEPRSDSLPNGRNRMALGTTTSGFDCSGAA